MEKFLFWTLRRWEIRCSFHSKSWCKMIFSLAWNTMFSEYGKVLVLNFRRWEIRSSFDSKSWCKITFSSAWNIIFFEYGKVLVLNFSEIGNRFFSWSKKLMETWYFLGIFELFMVFQNLGNMVFPVVSRSLSCNLLAVSLKYVSLQFTPGHCMK